MIPVADDPPDSIGGGQDQDPQSTQVPAAGHSRRETPTTNAGDLWPSDLDAVLAEALEEYRAIEARPSTSKFLRYFALCRFASDYILEKTGVAWTEEQVMLRLRHIQGGVMDSEQGVFSMPLFVRDNDPSINEDVALGPSTQWRDSRRGDRPFASEGSSIFGHCTKVELNNSHITICGGTYSHSTSHHPPWPPMPPPSFPLPPPAFNNTLRNDELLPLPLNVTLPRRFRVPHIPFPRRTTGRALVLVLTGISLWFVFYPR